jgi:hypothetical protein
MKRLLAAIFLCVFFIPNLGVAENKNVVVFAVEQGKPVAVSLVEKADYVAFAVTVISRQEGPEDELKEIGQARRLLVEEAKKNEKIRIHQGPIYMSSTSNSRTSFSYGTTQVTLNILFPLSEVDWDVFQAAAEITALVEKIDPPEKASYSLSPMKLAVEDPEKYRTKLLGMIDENIHQIRGLIKKTGKIFMTGIEKPVMVREFDCNQVEVFLDYNLSIEVEGE